MTRARRWMLPILFYVIGAGCAGAAGPVGISGFDTTRGRGPEALGFSIVSPRSERWVIPTRDVWLERDGLPLSAPFGLWRSKMSPANVFRPLETLTAGDALFVKTIDLRERHLLSAEVRTISGNGATTAADLQ